MPSCTVVNEGMDEGRPEQRYPIHGVKIDAFTVTPSVMAGADHVTVSWATRGAARLELWIDGRRWLCPLTANGSRRIPVRKATEFRLIAGPPHGAWIEAHASVMLISRLLFAATIVLTTAAIAALWWASQGFLSDVSLIESTPGWRTVSATSRVASFITALVGLPVLGSLLRLWPGANSSFGVRMLRHPPLAALWLGSCAVAVVGVFALWRSTETVILSSEVSGTVHFLDAGTDSVALAVPPGVSTAIVSEGSDGPLGWLAGASGGVHVLSGGNRTIPHRVYAERQGEVWILGCWSEVLVRHPPGFQATVELPDGRTIPVDLGLDEGDSVELEASADVLSVLARRARIPVPDCKRFPTHATLSVRDSAGYEALRLPFPLNLPPERAQWARARDAGRLSVQADVDLGVITLPHALASPERVAVQLSGDEGWRAAQCGRIDATVGSVFAALAADRSRLLPPLVPPGSASESASDLDVLQARCADPPTDNYTFLAPLRINGQPTRRVLGCAFDAKAVDSESPTALDCAAADSLPWRTTFPFVLGAQPPRLGHVDVCSPTTWDGHQAQLVEYQVLVDDDARPSSRWRGQLASGTHPIVWPVNHWAPGRAEIDVVNGATTAPEVVQIGNHPERSLDDRVRIADRTIDVTVEATWSDRVAEPVGVLAAAELIFDPDDQERVCLWTDETEIVVERTTTRRSQVSVTGMPASLADEVVDAYARLGARRLDCFLNASRGTFTCLR